LVPEYKNPNDGYARDLLGRNCLAGTVDYLVVPPGTSNSIIDERTGQLIFNESVAGQLGYPSLRASVNEPDTAIPDGVTITQPIKAAMEACGKKADERLGLPPEGALSSVESAGWTALSSSDKVRQAGLDWKKCMEPLGVVDLPDSPRSMPSRSVIPSDAVDKDGNVTGSSPSPSARERDVAVADARCQEQVGFNHAELEVRADAELAAIGKNIEGFESARTQYKTYEAGVDKVIAELG
jgi:hypothetical protein